MAKKTSQCSNPHPDPDVIALGIRQPWLELILRGIKTVEVRSMNTQIRGTIYLYASKKLSDMPAALTAAAKHGLNIEDLPRGMVTGSVELLGTRKIEPCDAVAACVPKSMLDGQYAWELTNPVRFSEPLPVRYLPYGRWFYPWRRRRK